MQIHRLSLEAIGPFASTFTVDFAALGQSGIFLLEGPTGAGKSTIIDAIVFALYGETAGVSSSKERLHSHHAAPGVRPWVELVFETAAGIYRVHRTPAHDRPKRRGQGTTTENASARLVRITSPDELDSGEVLSTSAAEVGGQMTGIIGLTREQFVQTVVLPQGEFAAFLRSSGEQRREVLQSIFRTRLYDDITSALIERRRDTRNALKDAQTGIDQAIAAFSAVTSMDGETAPDLSERGDLGILIAACQAVLDECSERSRRLEEQREEASKTVEAAAAALHAERALAEQLARRTKLIERRELLAHRAPGIEADRRRLELARRARGVRTALRGLAEARSAMRRSERDIATAKAAFGGGAEEATPAGLRERSIEIAVERNSIATLLAMAASFEDREKEIAGLVEEIDRFLVSVRQLQESARLRPAAREELTTRLAVAQAAASDLPIAERALADARDALSAARLVTALEEREAAARSVMRTLLHEAQTAQQEVFALRRARLAGMAGELALELKDGQPCTVCGSTQHPVPARAADDHPQQDAIDSAERRQAGLDAALAEANIALARLDSELEAARRDSQGLTEQEAAAAVTIAQDRMDSAAEAGGTAEDLAARLSSFDNAADRDDALIHEGEVAIARLRSDLEAKSATLDKDRADVAAASLGKASDLGELDTSLVAEGRRVEALRTALEAGEAAARAYDQRSTECDEALADSGFVEAAEAEEAALDNAEMARLDTDISSHDNEIAVVVEALAEPAIAALSGDERPAVEQAEQTFEIARQDLEAAGRQANAASSRAGAAEREFMAVRKAVAANESVIEAAAPVIRMADVADASGSANLRKLTLGSYVLVRRFEEVVKAANSRLGPMSDGRYQLQRSDEAEGRGGRKTGLSLRILDRSTGKSREPRTFSGGETFYASLCLALGLADVVRSEAGGTDLGTLFVDEGFGSLDPETLDAVMAQLSTLSSGGRTVGIVSHVEELKQRVADRISVRHNDDGSSRLSVNVGAP